jgi:serine/threonine protein kinase
MSEEPDGSTSDESSPVLPAVPLEPLRERDPRELGGFRMLGRLGFGGMGVAYLAESAGKWAVVKVVRSDLADSSTFRARLLRELEAMRRTEGPHTASLLASDLDSDPAWFAMEFIPGANLTRFVADAGPLPGDDLEGFARGLAEALAHVHAAGIIHRDLKPSNVMMSPTGPRLIDFGIAGLDEGTNLTKTGSVVGSTGWLAPEQVTGDPIGPAADIHAWALCVLFAATGTPPFGGDTSTAAMYRVLEVTPEVPHSISQPLRDLLVGAVAKDPAYRPTIDQVTTALATGSTAGWAPPLAPMTRSRTGPTPSTITPGESARPRTWVLPVAIAGGGLLALALILAAALGSTGQGDTAGSVATPTTAELPATGIAEPSDSVSPTVPAPASTPPPSYAVKIEYAGDGIPDAEFPDGLAWVFDVCSPDTALLAPSTANEVRLYASQGGSWQPVAAEADAAEGGRCSSDQVNLTIPHTEDEPAEPSEAWSKCRRYRVVIPETENYRKSNVDFCVRTRAS